MKGLVRHCATGLAIIGMGFLVLSVLSYAAGARINTTRSIPVGLYWTSSLPLARDAYVMFCPPPTDVFAVAKKRSYVGAGFCPGGYGYMMKQVSAVGGAVVVVTKAGVIADGHVLPNSAPLTTDLAGRLLPRYKADRYILDDSELLLMSNVSALSFDGRYFGPIKKSQVENVIQPIITW